MNYIKEIKKVLNEAAKVNFAGHSFILKVDVNEDPQKKGIKVQFLPTEFGAITPTEQNDIAIELEERLEKGLAEFGMRVERDRNLKDKTIVGFFIYIEYIDKIVRQALAGQNPGTEAAPEEEAPEDKLTA
jgi:hypothetical protein